MWELLFLNSNPICNYLATKTFNPISFVFESNFINYIKVYFLVRSPLKHMCEFKMNSEKINPKNKTKNKNKNYI
jgi:hypothetical protein